MNQLKEINLGENGLRYFQEQLSIEVTLAKIILEKTRLELGRIITFLPNYVEIEQAKDFDSGILVKPPKARDRLSRVNEKPSKLALGNYNINLRAELAKIIQKFLAGNRRACCLFGNPLARASDKWLEKAKSNLLIHNEEVYHFLSPRDTEQKILETIRETWSTYPPFIASLFSNNEKTDKLQAMLSNDKPKRVISFQDLSTLAEHTAYVIIGAYDGEGYVIWCKSELEEIGS